MTETNDASDTNDRKDVQVHGEIIQKDATKQIVTGPVLVPGVPDRTGDIVTKSNVEQVAHDYLATHRLVDEMHDERPRPNHAVVESWITKNALDLGGETVPPGAWMASVKLGDEAWSKVEDGTYTGFSIRGEGRRYHGRTGASD